MKVSMTIRSHIFTKINAARSNNLHLYPSSPIGALLRLQDSGTCMLVGALSLAEQRGLRLKGYRNSVSRISA